MNNHLMSGVETSRSQTDHVTVSTPARGLGCKVVKRNANYFLACFDNLKIIRFFVKNQMALIMEQTITKRNFLDKFSTHVQEIQKFLERTNYQNIDPHYAIRSIAKAREEEICNSQRVISLDRDRQSGIIEAVKGLPSFNNIDDHTACVSQHDLATCFFDKRYKKSAMSSMTMAVRTSSTLW